MDDEEGREVRCARNPFFSEETLEEPLENWMRSQEEGTARAARVISKSPFKTRPLRNEMAVTSIDDVSAHG